MTAEESDKLAEKAIEKCFWHNTEFGTPICKGNLAPCQVEIERVKEILRQEENINECKE